METSVASRDHLLTLKVMRLTKPTFYATTFCAVEDEDIAAAEFRQYDQSLKPSSGGQSSWFNSDILQLPQSFENIYLGETFTCYICVHNDSNQSVSEISVKVDLQTSSQRVSMPSKYHDAVVDLQPEQVLGQVMSHEVKEIGQHILVCAVTYKTPSNESMYFRKFFKFSVSKPLDVKTKFYNAESSDVYLEAQIQNSTHLPMCIERVSLDPSNLYNVKELNFMDEASGETTFATQPFLSCNGTRQYLYCLTPRSDVPPSTLKGVTSIGKLEMVWRTAMGERGRLQTSQLQRMVPGFGDVRLTVERTPSVVRLHEQFEVCCRVHNCCERTLDLVLALDESINGGLVCCSVFNRSLGKVEANKFIDLPLQFLPVAPGLQAVSGVRLTDTFLNRTYEHDEIIQVQVT